MKHKYDEETVENNSNFNSDINDINNNPNKRKEIKIALIDKSE